MSDTEEKSPNSCPAISARQVASYNGHVTRNVNYCKKALSSPDPSAVNLQFRKENLAKAWERYSDIFIQFEEQSNATGDEYDAVRSTYESTEAIYDDLTIKINDMVLTLSTPSPQQPFNTKLKLPTLELPTFEGDRKSWPIFWSAFSAHVHNNRTLTDIVKFTYLKSALKGEAAKRLHGFTGVGTDYQEAIKLLDDFYADKEAIINDLSMRILTIKAPKCNKDDLVEFQINYSNTIRQLKQYVSTVDQSDWIINPLLQSKLPEEFKKYLYDRYHVTFFKLKQIDDGITDFVKRFESQVVKPVTSDRSFESKLKQQEISTPTATVQNLTVSKPCVFCQQIHPSRTCSKFPTVDSRKAQLETLKRCKRCTAQHPTDSCNTQFVPCKTCGKTNHHGFLCYQLNTDKTSVNATSVKPNNSSSKNSGTPSKKNKGGGNSSENSQPSENVQGKSNKKSSPPANSTNVQVSTLCMNTTSTYHNNTSQYVTSAALPTASVEVQTNNSAPALTARAFFDQGAQKTFITKKLQTQLGLKPISSVTIGVMVGFDQKCSQNQFDIVRPILTLGNRKKRVSALVVDALPSSIQTPGLLHAVEMLKRNHCILADSFDSDEVRDIDILVGSDYYGRFMQGLTNRCGIDLIKSSAGYLIYGPILSSNTVPSTHVQHVLVARIATESCTPQSVEIGLDEGCTPVHKLWDLDAIGIDATAPSPQDDVAYQQYLNTLKFTDKYYARLPWKRDHDPLPHNYKMAVGQLHALISSLRHKPDLLDHYDKIIKEQLDNGFIERVPNPKITNSTHYIPHHAVMKDSPTTPVRIVYNCSAKSSKGTPSLNDCLMKGPSMTENLANILLIFRTNKYAFSADISKAFLRIGLQEVDRDFTRFLWVEDPQDPNSKLVTFRFAAVLFGAVSSPFLLQATLDHHLRNSDSPFKDYLSKSFYVDNLLNTTNNEKELLTIYDHANCELLGANMPLREWTSNNSTLLSRIRDDKLGTQSSEVNLLGLTWDTQEDALKLHSVQFFDCELTKRTLLSAVSSIFDPLGFYTPITIMGKQLLQSAWKLKIPWDEALPSEIVDQWNSIAKDFCQLSTYSIRRSVCNVDSPARLVVFCDSSMKAYGAVVYVISEGDSNLLLSKSRVTPLKSRTLPQLELTAIQFGVQLAQYVRNTLSEITFVSVTVFSDSEAALQWVRNDSSSITYVKNRVHHIRELSFGMRIFHVPSGQNPADLLSRGVTLSKFNKKFTTFWFKGPEWLVNEDEWPKQNPCVVVSEIVTDVPTQPEVPVQFIFDPKIASKFERVIKITQFVFKFLRIKCPSLSLPSPEVYWLRVVQQAEYPQVYKILSASGNKDGTAPLQKVSERFIKDLGLYLDNSGLIKSQGRLKHSLFHFNDQILLPPKSWITHLIILQAHRSIKHGGMSETLSEVRMQFWLPKGRQNVKISLKDCYYCRKLLAKPLPHPGPPPLPIERVTYNRPFESVGIDYTGAITIRDELTKMPVKVYICLFTCTCSRAVHLELAKDMSASTFLTLFRRFCARFSVPKLIICDNGSNFVATEAYFRSLLQDPSVLEYFSQEKIRWKFIAPRAPWQGGFYERMVGIVKQSLRKSIFKRTLNWDDLVTILLEVEQCINNRPLTYVESEIQDLQPLTPNHLIKGTSVRIMPSVVFEDKHDPLYLDHELLNVQYNKLSRVVQHFVQVWSKDYLISLKEKHFGNTRANQRVPVNVGDIVLVANNLARNHWPLGRISKVFPDPDNIIRTVEVFFQGHHSLRTLDKLYPLEITPDVVESNEATPDVVESNEIIPDVDESSDTVTEVDFPQARPRRAAARVAAEQRRALIASDQL